MIRAIHLIVPPEFSLGGADRFADELRRFAAGPVELRANAQGSDDRAAFLAVVGSEPPAWMMSLSGAEREAMLSRTILMRGPRAPAILEVLERHRLAGGIENLRYRSWETKPDSESGYGVVGLRQVVARIAGECAAEPFASEHYCVYRSSKASSLPQALAEYCDALALSS